MVPDRCLSSEVEESSSGGVFPTDEISRLQSVMLKIFVSQECTVKGFLYQSMGIFNRSNLGLCNIGVSLLLSVLGEKKQDTNALSILLLSQVARVYELQNGGI